MEKFKRIKDTIENLTILTQCDEDAYSEELLSELKLILKERDSLLKLLQKLNNSALFSINFPNIKKETQQLIKEATEI